jgi:hypothetical protein
MKSHILIAFSLLLFSSILMPSSSGQVSIV